MTKNNNFENSTAPASQVGRLVMCLCGVYMEKQKILEALKRTCTTELFMEEWRDIHAAKLIKPKIKPHDICKAFAPRTSDIVIWGYSVERIRQVLTLLEKDGRVVSWRSSNFKQKQWFPIGYDFWREIVDKIENT